MNAAQQCALKQVQDLLTEHFPASVVIVLVEDSDDDEDLELRVEGGSFQCYGLLTYAHENFESILDREEQSNE